jgi:hypothetical protein
MTNLFINKFSRGFYRSTPLVSFWGRDSLVCIFKIQFFIHSEKNDSLTTTQTTSNFNATSDFFFRGTSLTHPRDPRRHPLLDSPLPWSQTCYVLSSVFFRGSVRSSMRVLHMSLELFFRTIPVSLLREESVCLA